MKIRTEIKELFPTCDEELFYVPHCNDGREATGARGGLYNYYKYMREELRLGGMIEKKKNKVDKTIEGTCDNKIDSLFTTNVNINKFLIFFSIFKVTVQDDICLIDENRDEYETSNVFQKWEKKYSERTVKFLKNKNIDKNNILQIYFAAYPCLKSPLGVLLVKCQHFFYFLLLF